MNDTYADLLKVVKAYLSNSDLDTLKSDKHLLYNLSNSLNVPCIVGYALKKNKQYDNIFDKSMFKSLKEYNLLFNFKNELINILKKDNIRFIFLKGETIARYYVEPYLRYSSDLDIVIYKDDYDKALDIMLSKLDFKIKKSSINEKTLVNSNGINIDFHKLFELNNKDVDKLFDGCFNSIELDDDYKYVYHLNHEAKHFITGQLDLRFFVDLFYLRNSIDKDKVNSLLGQIHLLDFDKSMNSYLDVILGLKEYDKNDLLIEEYILSYANDQGASNRVSNKDNKIKYFINHAFPSKDVMKGIFPILDSKPYLLPWYYFVRIFKLLKSDRRKYVFNEVKSSIKDNKSDLIEELGLSSYNK